MAEAVFIYLDKHDEDAIALWELPCRHTTDYKAMDCGDCGPKAVAAAFRELSKQIDMHDAWRQETHRIALKVTGELVDRVNDLLAEVDMLKGNKRGE